MNCKEMISKHISAIIVNHSASFLKLNQGFVKWFLLVGGLHWGFRVTARGGNYLATVLIETISSTTYALWPLQGRAPLYSL